MAPDQIAENMTGHDFDCCDRGEHDEPPATAKVAPTVHDAFKAGFWAGVEYEGTADPSAPWPWDADTYPYRHDGFDHCPGCQAAYQAAQAPIHQNGSEA